MTWRAVSARPYVEEQIELVQKTRSEDNIFDAELRGTNLLCPGSAMFLTTVFVDNAESFSTFPKPLKDSSSEAGPHARLLRSSTRLSALRVLVPVPSYTLLPGLTTRSLTICQSCTGVPVHTRRILLPVLTTRSLTVFERVATTLPGLATGHLTVCSMCTSGPCPEAWRGCRLSTSHQGQALQTIVRTDMARVGVPDRQFVSLGWAWQIVPATSSNAF